MLKAQDDTGLSGRAGQLSSSVHCQGGGNTPSTPRCLLIYALEQAGRLCGLCTLPVRGGHRLGHLAAPTAPRSRAVNVIF